MREHKFRGRRLDNGEWVYGDLLKTEYGDCYICPNKYTVIDDFIQAFAVAVDTETVGQYTGTKDKNGKEICEGDVLRASDPKDLLTFLVQWYDYGGTNLLGINTFAFEIIGNIHENSDLLKESENNGNR